MAGPGDTIDLRADFAESLDGSAPSTFTAYRNGVPQSPSGAATVTGSSWKFSYSAPGTWLTTDRLQVFVTVSYDSVRIVDEVFNALLGGTLREGDTTAAALVYSDAPDATPTAVVGPTGAGSDVGATVTAGVTDREFVVTSPALVAGDNVCVATALFDGAPVVADVWGGGGGEEVSATTVPTATNHSPAQIVQQMLIDAGYGTAWDAGGDWPVYASNNPEDDRDDRITVTDTTGVSAGRVQTGFETLYDGLQVRVDSTDHPAGFLKADAVRLILTTVMTRTVVVGSDQYLVHNFPRVGSTNYVGKDVPYGKRSVFTLNPTVVITKIS